jgi:hypothetical protein
VGPLPGLQQQRLVEKRMAGSRRTRRIERAQAWPMAPGRS